MSRVLRPGRTRRAAFERAGSVPRPRLRMRPPEPIPKGALPLLGVCIGIAVVLIALPAYRLMVFESWHTGARVVRWLGPTGALVESSKRDDGRLSGCHGGVRFSTYVAGESVWTVCRGVSGFPAGAYARIDPALGEGRLAWPLPETLPLHHTVGIVPASDGRIAFIYRARAADGPLVLGVASANGWSFYPTELAGQNFARLLGAAWLDNRLEIAIVSGHADDRLAIWRDATMLTLHSDNSVTTRPVPLRPMCVKCSAKAAYRSRGAWRYLLQDEGDVLTDVSTLGDRKVSAYTGSAFSAPRGLDMTLSGLLVTADTHKRLEPDGTVGDVPKAPIVGSGALSLNRHYRQVSGRLWWTPRWYDDDTAQWVNGRLLVTSRTEHGGGGGMPADDETLSIADATDPANRIERTVARTFGFACGMLHNPSFAKRPGGGYWLVSNDGCYLAVSDRLERTDDLSLAEHLRRRGSVFLDHAAPRSVYYLGWMFAGFPLCLALGVALATARCRGDRHARDPMLVRYATVATMVFIATAVAVLFGVLWPLLR